MTIPYLIKIFLIGCTSLFLIVIAILSISGASQFLNHFITEKPTSIENSPPAPKLASNRYPPSEYEADQDPAAPTIVIEEIIKRKLIRLLTMPARSVPVNRKLAADEQQKFRSYVSVSMDLNTAEKRTNRKLKRVNYFMLREHGDVPRTLFEEMKKDGKILRLQQKDKNGSGSGSGSSVKLHYHEGPHFMEFEREKSIDERVHPVPREDANQMVMTFIRNMGLVNETKADSIHWIDVEHSDTHGQIDSEAVASEDMESEEIESEEIEGEAPGGDYTTEQCVTLRRTYKDIPVMNSSLRVCFIPGTNEVIQLAKRYWAPLIEKKEKILNASYSADHVKRLATKIERELRASLTEEAVGCHEALVDDVHYVYFQAEKNLKPLLLFEVSYRYQGVEEETDVQPGSVIIDAYK